MIRLLSILASWCFAVAVYAQQNNLGTKPDPGSSSSYQAASPSIMPLIQLFIVLGVVLFLFKKVGPKVLSKFNKSLVTQVGAGLKIEESATFAGGNLYIVQARAKTLLLGVGVNGVTCLADLTDPTPATPEPVPFETIIDDAVLRRGDDETPPRAAVEVETEDEQIRVALERLERFTA